MAETCIVFQERKLLLVERYLDVPMTPWSFYPPVMVELINPIGEEVASVKVKVPEGLLIAILTGLPVFVCHGIKGLAW